jgi:two-component system chemotaxis response regulator CheB
MLQEVRRDIVVIGGSTGAVEPIRQLLELLPADLAASIFVTVHIPPEFQSVLPESLSSEKWKARHPSEREKVRQGIVYIAPPDRHLVLERGHVLLGHGAKENRHRPAIDVLFRSAARAYGPRVAAIVLSGQLDDGSSGLMAVKMNGGLTVVQDPQEATAPEMPCRAIRYAVPARVVRVQEMADLLISVTDPKLRLPKSPGKPASSKLEQNPEEARIEHHPVEEEQSRPSMFACPECHGVLWEIEEGQMLRFRCRVGHAYTADALRVALGEGSEDALWVAMRVLEEKADLLRRLARGSGSRMKAHYEQEAAGFDRHASAIGKILLENQSLSKKEEEASDSA